MAGPVAFVKQVHPPTGITHCTAAYFTQVNARGTDALPDLVVARSTLLQVYAVREQRNVRQGHQLVLKTECNLFGVVETMTVLRNRATGKQRDAIILAFRDAKVSVLDWDANNNTVRTTSLHSFEGDPLVGASLPASPYGPRLLSDPQGRCAAVLLGHSAVAVLPATTTDILDEMMLGGGSAASQQGLPTTVGNSCILRLAKHGITEVRDAIFLHRYSEPVLLVLHEVAPTWTGNLRARKDTMAVTALSVNVVHKRLTLLWAARDLPSDACRLSAVPLGGALVLCRSLIKYVSQSGSCSLAVSSMAYAGADAPSYPADAGPATVHSAIRHAGQFATNVHPQAASSASKGAPRAEGFELDLTGSQGAWVAASTLLLGLASGQLVTVNLQADSGTVKRIKVSRVSAAAPPSCMCAVSPELILLGSCAGDSLLLRALPEQQAKAEVLALKTVEEALKDAEYMNGHDRKRQRTEPSVPGLDATDDEDEVSLLYRSEAQHMLPVSAGASKYSLQVADSLPSIGIMHSMSTGPVTREKGAGLAARGPPALVAAVGHDKAGALAVLQQSIVPELVTETPVADVQGVWAVHFFPEGLQADESALYHAFLLVSTRTGTKVLRTGEDLDELSAQQADFVLDSRTILAANLLQASRIAQVCPGGVTLLSGSSRVQYLPVKDLGVQGRVSITAATAADPHLLLHLSDGRAILLTADPTEGILTVSPDTAGRLAAKTSRISACSLHADVSATLAPDSAGDQAVCLLCRGTSLDILQVPSLEPLLSFSSASAGLPILDSSKGEALVDTWLPSVLEVAMVAPHERQKAGTDSRLDRDTGAPQAAYLIMLLSEGTLLIYAAFRRPSNELCFQLTQLPQALLYEAAAAVSGSRPACIKPFDNIVDGAEAFISGIFVGGKSPIWLVASRGTLVAHVMDCDGAVAGFTPFHNVGCPHGFFTACSGEGGGQALKMCRMPPKLRLDTPWPMHKAALRATPVALTFCADVGLYAVLVTRQIGYQPWLEETLEGDRDPNASHAYAVAEAAAKAAGSASTGEVRLIQPGQWQQAVWREALQQGETPCSLTSQLVRNTETDVMQTYLVAGTAYLLGEDCPCTGRVILFQITREDGQWQGKLVCFREVRGPVLDITVLDGVILAAGGTRLEILELKGKTLQRTAFYDAQILLRSVSVIKDYILLGDVHKSLTFVQSSQRCRQLKELSKDYNNLDVDAATFLRSGRKLYFLACDRGQSCHLFCYDPDQPQSFQGKRLIAVGRIHLGQTVCSHLPYRVMHTDKQAPALLGALLGTFSGAVCCVSPLWDSLPTTALLALQQELGFNIAQHAGLNPVSFRKRHLKTPKASGGGQCFEPPLRRINDILDADLLSSYMWLPLHQQEALATRCGVAKQTLEQAVLELVHAIKAIPQQS